MDTEMTIVAIELASSKVSAVAGQRQSDGSMKVLAYTSTPSQNCIRHGAVYNQEHTANAIATVISNLENMLSTKVERAFVGYNARTLRTFVSHVDREFMDDTVISQQVVDEMFNDCGQDDDDGYVTLLLESQEYTIDGRHTPETDPMGVACRRISGSYLKVLIGRSIMEYISTCFGMASVQIMDGYVSAIAESDVLLSDSDRQNGCALVDYGADTVTVSIYSGGVLRFMRVIPIGSSLITTDLAQILKIDHSQAETLKRTYGLYNESSASDHDASILISDRSYRLSEIGDIINARNEEIVQNIICRINDSGYAENLNAGVVLTGGGSQLKGLDRVFRRLMPAMPMPRIVTNPTGFEWVEPSWNHDDGSQISLLSVLTKGNVNCCDMPLPKMDDLERLNNENQNNVTMGSLFTMDGESAQDEIDRERQKRLEQERRAREESVEEPEEQSEEQVEKGGKKRKNRFRDFFTSIMEKGEDLIEQ